MFYVYILISETKKAWSYVGQTENLTRRIKEHQSGKVKSTKGRYPLKIIYKEKYRSREESLKREKYLKSGIGRDEKRQILNKYSGIV
ncbi:GIY-YIG nuclease family protein [Candidatus Parcubacteria bacterium]|nr:GIY-YIG nuclease family protein [Candidatus Parcubacteria bacterium]